MVTVMDKTKIPDKCNRPGCYGTYIESQGEPVCLTCGRPPTIKTISPDLPTDDNRLPKNYKDREANKLQIIADYNSMKRIDFLKKWHLATDTWMQLALEWKVPKRGKSRFTFDKMSQIVPATNTKPINIKTSICHKTVDLEHDITTEIEQWQYIKLLESKIAHLQALLVMEWKVAA